MEFEVEIKVRDIDWTQFMLKLLMTLFSYFNESYVSSSKTIKQSIIVRSSSFRDSYQHQNSPFCLFLD